jgi:hypothetical protein
MRKHGEVVRNSFQKEIGKTKEGGEHHKNLGKGILGFWSGLSKSRIAGMGIPPCPEKWKGGAREYGQS